MLKIVPYCLYSNKNGFFFLFDFQSTIPVDLHHLEELLKVQDWKF